MGRCSRMDLVYGIRRNIHRTLEPEGHVRSPQVIVDRLRKRNNMQSLFPQHICRLMGAIPSKYHQTVKVQLMICMLHSLHLVKAILIRHPHHLERLSGCPKDRPSYGQYSREISGSQHLEIGINQSLIPLLKPVNLNIVPLGTDSLYDAAHSGIQSLTVSSACKHSYS